MGLKQLGSSSPIKSIQTGTISSTTPSATATITSVDTAKSIVLWGGFESTSTTAAEIRHNIALDLTNATTVTAFTGTNVSIKVYFTVVEFN